jgi:hypothetical protein
MYNSLPIFITYIYLGVSAKNGFGLSLEVFEHTPCAEGRTLYCSFIRRVCGIAKESERQDGRQQPSFIVAEVEWFTTSMPPDAYSIIKPALY